jgi:hypothetical protein
MRDFCEEYNELSGFIEAVNYLINYQLLTNDFGPCIQFDCHTSTIGTITVFSFLLALQPQFGPWPTSMKLSVSIRVSRS